MNVTLPSHNKTTEIKLEMVFAAGSWIPRRLCMQIKPFLVLTLAQFDIQ